MIKYNLKLFEIGKKTERHKHFLVFLIRKFYPQNFDGTFTRADFIKTGIEKFGYNKNTIKGIFDKGIKENKFILKNYEKRGKKYYVLKSNTYKEKHNIIVKIENELIQKISSVNVFYTFCFLVISSKPFKYKIKDKEKIKIGEFNKVRGRTLNKIGETFNNFKKDNVLYHINLGKELFKPYFNVITRFIPFYTFEVPISSLYMLDGVEYYSDKSLEKGYSLYFNNLEFYFKEYTDLELKSKYTFKIKNKKGIKEIKYLFGKDLNLGKHFLDKKGKIMYDKLFDENYQKIIEKVIGQY